MDTLSPRLRSALDEIRAAGLYKSEREILGRQGPQVQTRRGDALNFCANNYLGLAGDPRPAQAAKEALDRWGFGLSSVRFICGTQDQHRAFENEIAAFLGTEDAILFSSCFDANGGVFDALFGPGDAIISDELNHASLIDGIRLCKATRYRYRNADMDDLRAQLLGARNDGADQIVIVTDGVFSMDGSYAPLPEICDLAEEFHALVLVDDSHATGFVGDGGKGTPEFFGVADRVDILTGTLGKALGGASGGYVAGPQAVIDMLRQKARPYLFSNTLAPAVVAGSREALRIAAAADAERAHLREVSALFRQLMAQAGFTVLPGSHPIHAVMFPGDDGARVAAEIAERMLDYGVYVVAFSFPVVPRQKARIRVQLSAAHSREDVVACVDAFIRARAEVVAPAEGTH
ncbi:glycine C-acetyltransferase [Schaalia suimastitidis]|uniref:glycine C-acetyltransferase n=1 Tax=Schaalia suimastitidis TaxID=121163 RepID=UPI0004100E63|nr:glycine C-acetyltransferase [Schaalia suimastitidis]